MQSNNTVSEKAIESNYLLMQMERYNNYYFYLGTLTLKVWF